ncbi:uncharacterized protein [Palaemon carinicauda]|uniref:uncharacterized protein n=1 Tax=Palaemon carinicauda TaxID=392227 RepID=UPI0035B5967A
MKLTMKTSLSSCLVLLMLVSNAFAKSLVLNDVPDPPMKFSFRMPVAREAHLDMEHSAQKDQETTYPNGDGLLSVAMYKSSVTIHDAKAPLPVIKFKSIITSDQVKDTMELRDEPATGVSTTISTPPPPPTTTTPTPTTTEDPWEAFCNEACQEGLAGPECDCAEHPIGRRAAYF